MTNSQIPSSELKENETVPWFKTVKGIAAIAGVSLLLIGGVVYFAMLNKKSDVKNAAKSTKDVKKPSETSAVKDVKKPSETPAVKDDKKASDIKDKVIFFARNTSENKNNWHMMSFYFDGRRGVSSWDSIKNFEKSEQVFYNDDNQVLYRTKDAVMSLDTSNVANSPTKLFDLNPSTNFVFSVSTDGKNILVYSYPDEHILDVMTVDEKNGWTKTASFELNNIVKAHALLSDKQTIVHVKMFNGRLNICTRDISKVDRDSDTCAPINNAMNVFGMSPDAKYIVYNTRPNPEKKLVISERVGSKILHEIDTKIYFVIHKWTSDGFYCSFSNDFSDKYTALHKFTISTGTFEKVLDSHGKDVIMKYN